MMYRVLTNLRVFPSSIFVRLSSTTQIPIRNQPTIDNDNDDEEDVVTPKKLTTPEDYIFADSKSVRFKEKNKRKQKKWIKELEQRKISQQTPLSSLMKEAKTKFEGTEEKLIRDSYVTPDGVVREDDLPLKIDLDDKENEEEKESTEPVPLAVGGRRQPIWYYAGKLQQLALQNKVEETLNYFYNEMMAKERVAPNLFCYQVVIGICARNGYLAQTFDLYREMKDRGYTTVDSRKMTKIFTLLAHACYRASDRSMAIERAMYFLDEMKEKKFRIEHRTYNALIAAFGKHGEVKMAFQLADEMVEVGFIPDQDTYVSLLIACQSDKTLGFRYAIETWRRMLAFGAQPTAFHFGLLLNITHQCGLGSTESMHELLVPPNLDQLIEESEKSDEADDDKKMIQSRPMPSFLSTITSFNESSTKVLSSSDDQTAEISSSDIVEHRSTPASSTIGEWWQNPDDIRHGNVSDDQLRPFSNANILKPNVSYEKKNLLALRMPRSPAERLMLLGGIPGVLKHMQEYKIVPNNIIFNTFLQLIPPIAEHEQALIHVSNLCQIKPNIQFYNALILRRLRRGAKTEALQVLDLMREECLTPDIYTFSALAKNCENRNDAEQLLSEMKDLNMKPNQKVLDAMLNNAFHRINFPLLSLICDSYRTYNLSLNEASLQRIEKFLLEIRSKILAMERANIDNDQYRLLSSSYDRFQKFYNTWLRDVSYAKRFDQKVSFVFDKPDLKK